MASLSDPKYGVNVIMSDTTNKTYSKTFNYVNLAIGGASSGYGVNDILEFLEAVVSLSGGSYVSSAVTSQMTIDEAGE